MRMRIKMNPQKRGYVLFALFITGLSFSSTGIKSQETLPAKTNTPKIVNIVNFIRLLEPRDSAITEGVLYETVAKQIEIMKKYRLPGTFLLQYDALMDPRYQELLKSLPRDSFEIGAWWEIPQPLVEHAGMKWRGRYPWDWRANIGFSTGYSPKEREKLVDVYMADFKKVFGYYPKSVGCWFIDAYSLKYMYQKYHIVASCNCKDQYGTDGYTLWGGYWNQAYYPSNVNAYMPAQHAANQIPVPIFRMLGSDPIRQYDNGLSSSRQGVVTLEPVYPEAGGDSAWVNWFLQRFTQDVALGFNYTQAGQENSFTWNAMKKGFGIQMPLLAQLRNENKLRVETMETSGRWFRKKYSVTPATSFPVSKDIAGSDRKTIWFDSRYYRVNLLWENGSLRIRDIHLFNENIPSAYDSTAVLENECRFFTLPFVDGYLWSKAGDIAGLRFNAVIDGKISPLKGGDPKFTISGDSTQLISWPLANNEGSIEIELSEKKIRISLKGIRNLKWFLDMDAAIKNLLPFEEVTASYINCRFENNKYQVSTPDGIFSIPGGKTAWRLSPKNNTITLNLDAPEAK
jgi:hypothetical protein